MLHTGMAANGVDASKDPSSITPLGVRPSSGVHDTGPADLVELIQRLHEIVCMCFGMTTCYTRVQNFIRKGGLRCCLHILLWFS